MSRKAQIRRMQRLLSELEEARRRRDQAEDTYRTIEAARESGDASIEEVYAAREARDAARQKYVDARDAYDRCKKPRAKRRSPVRRRRVEKRGA